ncbi:cardiolipin synthase [Eubacteriaceae bacterium ES2]|nr:cardiolipin synthase [Eubacteriaceae bacterium ES2]
MKQFFKVFDTPIFYTASAVCVQLGFLVLFLYYLSSYSSIVYVMFTIINILILLFLISKDDSPSYKVIWIIIILAVPLIGGVIYLLFGNKRASRRMGMKITEESEQLAPFMQPNKQIADKMKNGNSRAAGIVHYLQNKCAFPVWENTLSNYYPIGEELYAAMLADLKNARQFIFMEYFIIEPGIVWNNIFAVLCEKAAQGVEVRLMYDDLGCVNTLPKGYAETIRAKGIKCIPFNPVMPFLNLAMNNRDHRKITVIDGNIAFSGGVNLADEYINQKAKYGHWKDTGMKIEGAAVWNFTAMFLEIWNAFSDGSQEIHKYMPNPQFVSVIKNDGFVLPFADSPVDDETTSQNVYIDILNQAKNYVYIFTPYLIIDNEMQNALRMAVKRGVDVRMITPGIPDKKLIYRVTRANYKPLIEAGVKIYEYTPGFCHAKSFVSDDNLAVVGTINLDFRSLYLHFECGLLLYGTSSIMAIKNDFLETLSLCTEVSSADLKQSFFWQLFDTVIRAFSPLM